MPQFKQDTFGTDTWQLGSRGKAGSFRNPGLPLIRNMRMRNDGSLIVRPAWFRWGWHTQSVSYLTVEGKGSSLANVMAFHYYRSQVLGGTLKAAVSIIDSGGTVVFDRENLTSPPTELFSDTTAPARSLLQYGFGNVDALNRYDLLMQGMLLNSQAVGAADGKVTNGRSEVQRVFIPGSSTYVFVGSTFHQGRAFYWGLETDTASDTAIRDNRIWYSDPYAYTEFESAEQYFDVDGEVRGAVSIGPNLIIWTVEGNWFVLQGRGDPARGVKHTKGIHRVPQLDDQPARLGDVALYNSADFDVVCIIDRDGNIDSETLSRFGGPGFFTGPLRRSPPAASPLQDVATVPLSTLGEAIHLSRGVWTEEEWNLTGKTLTDRMLIRSHPEKNEEWLALPNDKGGGVWEYELYSRRTITNAPSEYEDVTGSQPAETVNGELHLPRVWDPDFDIRIKQVTIDAVYWKDGGSVIYDTLNLEARAVGMLGVSRAMDVGQDPDTISSLPDGKEYSVRLTASPSNQEGDPFESWYEIQLFNIRSFAIQQVMVEYELSPRRYHTF